MDSTSIAGISILTAMLLMFFGFLVFAYMISKSDETPRRKL